MTTIIRDRRRREFASTAPNELQTTTRRSELGDFPALKVEGKDQRFDAADLAVLEPSAAAIELAIYLGKPDAFLADYRALVRKPAKHTLADDEQQLIKDLRRSRTFSPAEREDLIKAIWSRSRADKKARDRECRKHVKRWIALVRMYELRREELRRYSEVIRQRIVARLVADVRRAASNDIPAFDKEERKRRNRNIKENRKAAKRNREAFGHRKTNDGWNSEGHRDQSYRQAATPMTPDGEVDVEELKKAELLIGSAMWGRDGTNGGIGIRQGTIEEEGDQWSVTEQNRFAKRLTDEMNTFLKLKRSRAV